MRIFSSQQIYNMSPMRYLHDVSVEKDQEYQDKINRITDEVLQYFNVSLKTIKSTCRKRTSVEPRQILMALLKNNTSMPLTKIGLILGGKDHTTVIHSYRNVCNLMRTDDVYRENIEIIEKNLDGDIIHSLRADAMNKKYISIAQKKNEEVVVKIINKAPAVYSNHSPLRIAK